MCGIIGVGSTYKQTDKEWLTEGRDIMKHRGPDDGGIWWSEDEKVGFGHRRLSIIDLSEQGHQPMHSNCNSIVIIFNGEIYNYLDLKNILINKGHFFRTNSDTEVIIEGYKEWGIDILSKLIGMFAFAIYDNTKNTIFIARDRVGEKPLFYSYTKNQLYFSSELKGLFKNKKITRNINNNALDCYLNMGFVPGEMSIIDGINKLPAAHYIEYDLSIGTININQYWSIPSYEDFNKFTEDELLYNLENLLENSVKKQLIADVPVGILLSGGVDSSLITALAAKNSNKIKTFTVRFPGNKLYDESNHAKLISNYFNTDHHELDADEVSVDLLAVLSRQFDEPIVDSSMIPTYLVTKALKNHCTVALGGDGGDELFGGYGHYPRLIKLKQLTEKIPRPLRSQFTNYILKVIKTGTKGRNWITAFDSDFEKDLPLIAQYFDKRSRSHLINNSVNWKFNAEKVWKSRTHYNNDIIDFATRTDFNNFLPEDILVKVDRASMLNSVEIRAPFLNHNLIEFAFRDVKSNQKANSNERKILLKKLCSKILPSDFDKKRKQGFSVPLNTWLKNGPWYNYFEEILLNSNNDLFNKNQIISLLKQQKNGYNNSERLFSLTMLELWRNEYNINF